MALKSNVTLETLLLRNNNITARGAIALAEGLEFNVALKKLYISDNKISFDAQTSEKFGQIPRFSDVVI